MSFEFLTANVWARITKDLSCAKAPCQVAVAYLGKGGASLLPLPARSKIVVDASLAAVKSGQTHPGDLLALHKDGVQVFSRAALHAKVFVAGGVIIVGSANASQHSARVLTEAVVRSTDPAAIDAGRRFVEGLCIEPLGPGQLERLQRHYRPPRTPGRGKPANNSDAGVSVYLARTFDTDLPEVLEKEGEAGNAVAKRKRSQTEGFEVKHVLWEGTPPFKEGQLVVQLRARDKQSISKPRTVGPPGHVIHLARSRSHPRRFHVYIEVPDFPPKLYSRLKASDRKLLSRGGTKNTARSADILAIFGRD